MKAASRKYLRDRRERLHDMRAAAAPDSDKFDFGQYVDQFIQLPEKD